MIDLVERLRLWGSDAMSSEAAAEIEWLRAHVGTLVQERDAERKIYNDAIARHLAQITEAAAFLDRQADHLGHHPDWEEIDRAAADCRAMASKLRGEAMSEHETKMRHLSGPQLLCPRCTEVAAFLDGLAEPLRIAEQFANPATGPLLAPNGAAHELVLKAAAECREMARKLRSET